MQVQLKTYFNDLQMQNIKLSLESLNRETKKIKTQLKVEKDFNKRSVLQKEHSFIATKLSLYYNAYNLLKNKTESHKFKQVRYVSSPLKKRFNITDKLILLFNKDIKEFEIYVLNSIKDASLCNYFTIEVSDLFSNTKKTINVYDMPNFIFDNRPLMLQLIINTYGLSKQIVIDNISIENLDDKLYLKLILFESLLEIENDFQNRRNSVFRLFNNLGAFNNNLKD